MSKGESRAYRYDAFVSYRHHPQDRKWARWLHSALERYRTPRRLVKEKGLPERLGRVFRDEDELAASPHLSEGIQEALEQSRFLVVVCSPRTPQSRWVDEEVRRFRQLGRGENILALLVEGEPRDAFPGALAAVREAARDEADPASAAPDSIEPLAADVRPLAGVSSSERKRNAKLRILAPMLGCAYDDLRRRHQERVRRRLLGLVGAMACLLVLLLGLTYVAVTERRSAEDHSRAEKTARLVSEAARGEADALVDLMLVDLRKALEPIGRMDLLQKVADRAASYYERVPRDDAAPSVESQRADAFEILGDVFSTQGRLSDALKAYEQALDRRRREAPAVGG